jgi:hypothetical protein
MFLVCPSSFAVTLSGSKQNHTSRSGEYEQIQKIQTKSHGQYLHLLGFWRLELRGPFTENRLKTIFRAVMKTNSGPFLFSAMQRKLKNVTSARC